ncbi:MAG: hypothetical protein ACI9R3_002675 [Verrucomicrobiales bacterium]|jgi:hypothetical protein
MKLLIRFSAVFLLFSGAVCAIAVIAHRAEEESNLIHRCREQLADQGLKDVNVMCRGSEAVLAGNVASIREKAIALKLISSLDGIQQVSSMSLVVAGIGNSAE